MTASSSASKGAEGAVRALLAFTAPNRPVSNDDLVAAMALGLVEFRFSGRAGPAGCSGHMSWRLTRIGRNLLRRNGRPPVIAEIRQAAAPGP